MNINFNVTGSERKRLVSIITHATGDKGTYEGVPTMAYRIGGFTVDKTGGLSWHASQGLRRDQSGGF